MSPGIVGPACHPDGVSQTWGQPATQAVNGWAVVDVETSGFRPGAARVLSVAVLALDAGGRIEQSVASLLNPGVDPGPTHIHGLTAEMLEDQPTFAEIAGDIAGLLAGRTLVAHNAGFDYSFLTAEAELAGAELPIDRVMCTVELARRLDLGLDNVKLETLVRNWDLTQSHPHDAFDDALVLSKVLRPLLDRAAERDVWLPVRPVGRRRWPNGRVTHDELRPLKALAARLPCRYRNPGRYSGGLARGMRVALSAECSRTHEELLERLLDVGLAYADAVDPQTSLVVCNDATPAQGKGLTARTLGVPVLSDEAFMAGVRHLAGGADGGAEPPVDADEGQFTLF